VSWLDVLSFGIGLGLALLAARWLWRRWQLLRAKHPSLRGHNRWARRIARLVPYYEFQETEFFASDGAPATVASQRRASFEQLGATLRERWPVAAKMSGELQHGLSDAAFTSLYRVPFQYRRLVKDTLTVGTIVEETAGVRMCGIDGDWSYDLTGAYGVNVFGYDFYKSCIAAAVERAGRLGPVLGPYHPVIGENVRRLKQISGLDEVSFHMSGTEAVMQAVRLARFHTGRSHVVQFSGAYHGWWDGVQPGVGNDRRVNDVYTLREISDATLTVLETRSDIACVLVNPLQAMHPNSSAPSDTALVDSGRSAAVDKVAYATWLSKLREVCTRRRIPLLFDEVFVGFRLARGGAQEYFGVRADLVTYGKTLGGGLPIGVVCGTHELMQRYDDANPARVSLARGTFNSHPYVMTAMDEFLRRIEDPSFDEQYARIDEVWDGRAKSLNERLQAKGLPVRVVNLASIWTVLYTRPSRYNWMFQYFLRAQGLTLSWIGTGRLIFSHNFTDVDFDEVEARFVRAAEAMADGGWWWDSPTLSNRSIRRAILSEMVSRRLRAAR
jgi:glutamate-1-semialdehyde 2,1-aminomutase